MDRRSTVRRLPVIVAVTVTPDGGVGGGLGRAQTVALADVRENDVADWTEVSVGWGDLHGTGPEGTHHARIVRFLRDNEVQVVVTTGLGAGMRQTLAKLGVDVRTDLAGDARAAARAAAADSPHA
jgi:predicted Fe-Mo cluster-binding NifX family protein